MSNKNFNKREIHENLRMDEKETKRDYVKSMSAKLRHAAKNDFHRYDFNSFGNKNNLESKPTYDPHSNMSNQVYLFKMFSSYIFKEYMLKNYQIVPFMLTSKRIRKVILSFININSS